MKRGHEGADTEAPCAAKHARVGTSTLQLNVGGTRFHVSRQVLNTFPSSYFGSLASGRIGHALESDGSIFIDRDPEPFPFILKFLRTHGDCLHSLPENVAERTCLQNEADYYGLTGLVEALRSFRVKALFCATLLHTAAANYSPNGRFIPTAFKIQGCHKSGVLFDVATPDNFEFDVYQDGQLEAGHCIVGPPRPYLIFGVGCDGVDLSSTWKQVKVDLRGDGNQVAVEYPATDGVFLSLWKVPEVEPVPERLLDEDGEFVLVLDNDGRTIFRGDNGWFVRAGFRFFSSTPGGCSTVTFYGVSPEGHHSEIYTSSQIENVGRTFRPIVYFGSANGCRFRNLADWGNL